MAGEEEGSPGRPHKTHRLWEQIKGGGLTPENLDRSSVRMEIRMEGGDDGSQGTDRRRAVQDPITLKRLEQSNTPAWVLRRGGTPQRRPREVARVTDRIRPLLVGSDYTHSASVVFVSGTSDRMETLIRRCQARPIRRVTLEQRIPFTLLPYTNVCTRERLRVDSRAPSRPRPA